MFVRASLAFVMLRCGCREGPKWLKPCPEVARSPSRPLAVLAPRLHPRGLDCQQLVAFTAPLLVAGTPAQPLGAAAVNLVALDDLVIATANLAATLARGLRQGMSYFGC